MIESTSLPNFAQLDTPQSNKIKVLPALAMVLLGLGFGLFLGNNNTKTNQEPTVTIKTQKTTTLSQVSSSNEITIGKTYGSTSTLYKDKATGVLVLGSINGVGTHILERPGKNQNISLISSALDLDLFVGKTVDILGQTNASNKTGWLLDVGQITVVK